MKFDFSGQIFERYSSIKFHEIFFPMQARLFHGLGGRDGQTDDMTKMIVNFRSFANSSKIDNAPSLTGFISNPNQH
jgi:hypothetical protein